MTDREFIKKGLPSIINNACDVGQWVGAFSCLKQIMDRWFISHPKQEREFQQLVVRENNSKGIGESTDYFIIDVEYDNHDRARFDMVAIEWESDKVLRKLPRKYRPKLCFIEMKYGDGALGGNAGIVKHISDMQEYVSSRRLDSIKKEMTELFMQKRELGLISALVNNRNVLTSGQLADEVDYIFLLANHDPAKSALNEVLQEVDNRYSGRRLDFNIRFCCSTFMGYGIYKENVYSFQDFQNLFYKQILCT